MSETMKHTPGPWVVKGQKSIRGPNGEYIAKANWQNGMANAKLIAASPELLLAARAVIAQWETPNWKLTEPTAKFMNDLRSAVARAENQP